jgi:MarR family transcriptional regulator, lower aerobic nicotinate degradation pathway regulator
MTDSGSGGRDGAGPVPQDLGIVDSLVQLSFLIQEILGRAAARHDLSVTQLRLLGVLRDREPGMQELARHLRLDKSSVTGLVDRAERRGLVRRATHPRDGRAVRVASTAAGQQLTTLVAQEIGDEVAGAVRVLPGADRSRLSELASAVVQAAAGYQANPT